ncbi:MAG: FkbM family methyltransferase, partial [Candidatus Accumulibacter sp.]|nr:FkbM family methyltransferase [Accumulibacter sp.]
MQGDGADRARKIKRLAACFGAGDLAAAEEIARQLLAADARDGEAAQLLAQIVFKQGRAEEAIEPMRTALDADPLRSSYHNDYGVMLASLGRWNDAAAAHEMAVVLERNHADARFNLALALFRGGQRERARAELDQVLSQWPDLPEAMVLEGELLRAEGRPAEAVEAFRKAIERGLETPELYVNLGLALEDAGRGEEARQALLRTRHIGADADACFTLGNFYRGKGNQTLAERFFRQALVARPDFAGALNNLGLLLQEGRRHEEAAQCFGKALKSDPKLSAAHINLGNLRGQEGWMEGAIDCFRRALEIDPDSPDAWNNLGLIHFRLRRMEEAETEFRRALEIRPDYAEADLNLGILLLLQGEFGAGWPHYESRWKMPRMAENRPRLDEPEWTGAALGSRTLLVYSEQGLGDNLHFARYLPLLRRHHPQARICLWCLPQLYRLFESCAAAWGVETLPPVMPGGLPPYDAQIALLSLPWRMGTTLDNIPADVPYLAPPPALVEKWTARLGPLPGKKVGLVWASGETYAQHKFRTVRLKQLEPLLGVGGVRWVSLQKGRGASQIVSEGFSHLILNPMDEVEDFADTAAIVANLDLVISVDTSVPHLAGAMGKPVWLLDRFDTDWRWLLERADSPWYPTMRIFRQTRFGEWAPVVARMREALRAWVGEAGDGDPGVPPWKNASPRAPEIAALIDACRDRLAHDPSDVTCWTELGHACVRANLPDAAIAVYEKVLQLDPGQKDARVNLGMLYLLTGNLREGWKHYEARRLFPETQEPLPPGAPEWSGEPLDGKTLLVHREQGYGDDLQFARYLSLLRDRYPAATIAYVCPRALWRLMEGYLRRLLIVPLKNGGNPGGGLIDYQIALLSLPRLFDTTLQSIPPVTGYPLAPELAERWKNRLSGLTGLRVGIVWSGGALTKGLEERRLPRANLPRLFEPAGVSWVSLQYGDQASSCLRDVPAGVTVVDPMGEVEDFADTAAIIAELDLVISVDTAVAHLSGSLGCPTWLILPWAGEWRWLIGRGDSPWYPSMRIFRQPRPGDWDSVISRVAQALAGLVKAGGGKPSRTPAPEAPAIEAALTEQVFGGEHLNYRIVRARHGWMLANPNDFYIGRALLEYGEYGEIESGFLHRCLFKPGRVVEVGANMGSHTVGLAKAAAAKGEEMMVFEPQPVVFQNLCANLALNGLRNVRAWPFACGDETGMVSFPEQDYGRPGNFGGVAMSHAQEGPGRIAAPCVRLDDFLGEGAVALIKIDVEGFELAVLRGADETLRRWRPVLYVENDRVNESKALIEWLWSRGYRLFWHVSPLFNPDNLFGKSANDYGNVASFNMVCIPEELVRSELSGLDEIVDSSKHPLLRTAREGSCRAQEIKRLAACWNAGDLAAAENLARGLLARDGRDEEALHLLAQTVFRQGRAEEAVERMRAVLDIDPLRASYHNDHGVMLASLGRWDEAVAAYEMAVVLDRGAIDARFNLALALFRTGQKARARAELDPVLAARSDLADAWALDGELLRAEGRHLDAAGAFSRAAARAPEHGTYAALLLHEMMYMCQWDTLDDLVRRVRAAIENDTAEIPPFIVLSMPGTTPALQRRCAENQSARLGRGTGDGCRETDGPIAPASRLPSSVSRGKRLRVGYLSSDFKNHATALLMMEMLEAHDRSRFEIFALSHG